MMRELAAQPLAGAERRWRAIVIGGILAVSALLFAALLPVPRADGALIGSDGVGYYVYLPSLVIDGDLDFTNQYAYYAKAFKQPPPTPRGLPGNKYAVGPALLWLPFFLGAHLAALAARALGWPVAADGMGFLYQSAIAFGSIAYGTLGIWLAYRCARRYFSALASLAAAALIWCASNLIYYMVFEPSMSHMVSLFSVALACSIWLLHLRDTSRPSLAKAAWLGCAGGLVLLVRLQDAPLLLLPYGALLLRWADALRAGDRAQARAWLLAGGVVAACTLAAFAPQLIVWRALYGSWLTSPYAADHDPLFNWLQPQIVGVLLSGFHGLFSWHPIYLAGLAGLAGLARRDRGLALGMALALALEVYVVAAWWAWWQGDSFGGRMFLSAAWIWLCGLAGAIDWLWARRRLRAPLVAAAALLVIWNGLALAQYRLGFVPMSAPLTLRQMTLDRIALPLTLIQKVLRR